MDEQDMIKSMIAEDAAKTLDMPHVVVFYDEAEWESFDVAGPYETAALACEAADRQMREFIDEYEADSISTYRFRVVPMRSTSFFDVPE